MLIGFEQGTTELFYSKAVPQCISLNTSNLFLEIVISNALSSVSKQWGLFRSCQIIPEVFFIGPAS